MKHANPVDDAPTPPSAAVARIDALDGLRTIAVFLVVLFHVSVPGMAAGFLGVDVFFVLSGYLITSGLVRELQKNGRINLIRFWTRRVRRLMPAAMLILLVVVVWTWTAALDYRRPMLAGDTFATLFYVANWRFMQAGSYFSSDGTQSPLLHMWSLAVEEQFYLLWPLILLATSLLAGLVWKLEAKPIVWLRDRTGMHRDRQGFIGEVLVVCVLILIASATLLAVLYQSSESPDRAYMGTDSKAFEPLLGAGVAMLSSWASVENFFKKNAKLFGWFGLIVGPILFMRMVGPSSFYFNGGAVFFSIAVAALMIGVTRAPAWALSKILAWGPIAYLGRISYGIYLWHWPLAVWFETHAAFSPARALVVIVATVMLASLSYRLFEQPILKSTPRDGRSPGTFVVAGISMATLSLMVSPLGGTPLAPVARLVLPTSLLPKPVEVMMVGDSVPLRLLPVLAATAKERGIIVGSATAGGCSPLGVHQVVSEDDREGAKCSDVRRTQAQGLASMHPRTVIWWSRYEIADRYQDGKLLRAGDDAFWQAQLADFDDAIDRLTVEGAAVVVVQTEPPGVGMLSRCTPEDCHPFLRRMVEQDELRVHWNKLITERARRDDRIRTISMDDVACRKLTEPTPTGFGSDLCDDTVEGEKLARPDGSHWDTELVGSEVSNALLDRALAQR
ncbi:MULTISPECIES: acyltransferase family protein [unclassified Luteococcus]|uniref:acyltransferase family protein n=1 Tax=unclassified Luteococcus TaxID=2639923 RepID=UPI00313F0E56